ncbi:MAG: XTP/dITP diphosphatase [Nitrospirae bacterium]|nr:XTP/dITP diphosphatase [Nitrospirota bacterium]
MKELVLATRNPHKGTELAALLEDLGIRIRTLAEFPDAPEVVEEGKTCEANAVKKAVAVARHTGLPAVADDTGLEVEALGGRPGVHAARYAGEGATYEDNWRKLLRELEGVPWERRRARFITVAAIATPSGKVEVVEGVLEGLIAEAPAGGQGFGYDPVFLVPELSKTLAQLTAEEKNRVSHRAGAFARMREILKKQ